MRFILFTALLLGAAVVNAAEQAPAKKKNNRFFVTANAEPVSESNLFVAFPSFRSALSEPKVPAKIPSFWWSFVLSAIGAYTLYGLAVGPISVIVVYFASERNKREVRLSLWGWLLGTVFGIGLWLLFKLI